jgi:hypothetical protein
MFEFHWLQMLLGFIASMIGVGFRAFQTKNMMGNHKRLAAFTCYLIAGADIGSITLIAHNGWSMWLPLGTGAAIGVVASMTLHDKFVKPKSRS